MFYNYVGPNEGPKYVKPANIHQDLWDQAQRDNPDPSWFVFCFLFFSIFKKSINFLN